MVSLHERSQPRNTINLYENIFRCCCIVYNFRKNCLCHLGSYGTVALHLSLEMTNYFFMVFNSCTHLHSSPIPSCGTWISSCSKANTKSLVNTNSFNTYFTNTRFQKVPIPHLMPTMKQKFLH